MRDLAAVDECIGPAAQKMRGRSAVKDILITFSPHGLH